MSTVLAPPKGVPTGEPPLMTTDEFLAKHIDDDGIEFVRGKIVRLPMPEFEHGRICGNVYFQLRLFVEPNRRGRLATNDSFIRMSSGNVRGPDVMFISYARLPADIPTPKGAIDPPVDLVVEVRSPSDYPKLVDAKVEEYLESGVTAVLVIDPRDHSAIVHRPGKPSQDFAGGDTLTLPDVLPGFAVEVAKFFE